MTDAFAVFVQNCPDLLLLYKLRPLSREARSLVDAQIAAIPGNFPGKTTEDGLLCAAPPVNVSPDIMVAVMKFLNGSRASYCRYEGGVSDKAHVLKWCVKFCDMLYEMDLSAEIRSSKRAECLEMYDSRGSQWTYAIKYYRTRWDWVRLETFLFQLDLVGIMVHFIEHGFSLDDAVGLCRINEILNGAHMMGPKYSMMIPSRMRDPNIPAGFRYMLNRNDDRVATVTYWAGDRKRSFAMRGPNLDEKVSAFKQNWDSLSRCLK